MTEKPTTAQNKHIRALANEVFRDKKRTRDWLTRPHMMLEDQRPVDVKKTRAGAERVIDLLGRLKYSTGV